jgi:hypothetical protein
MVLSMSILGDTIIQVTKICSVQFIVNVVQYCQNFTICNDISLLQPYRWNLNLNMKYSHAYLFHMFINFNKLPSKSWSLTLTYKEWLFICMLTYLNLCTIWYWPCFILNNIFDCKLQNVSQVSISDVITLKMVRDNIYLQLVIFWFYSELQ